MKLSSSVVGHNACPCDLAQTHRPEEKPLCMAYSHLRNKRAFAAVGINLWNVLPQDISLADILY